MEYREVGPERRNLSSAVIDSRGWSEGGKPDDQLCQFRGARGTSRAAAAVTRTVKNEYYTRLHLRQRGGKRVTVSTLSSARLKFTLVRLSEPARFRDPVDTSGWL